MMVPLPSCDRTTSLRSFPSRPTNDETFELRKIMTTPPQCYERRGHNDNNEVESRALSPSDTDSSHGYTTSEPDSPNSSSSSCHSSFITTSK